MEFDAGRFEIEATEIEDAAHAGADIVDDILMLNSQDIARRAARDADDQLNDRPSLRSSLMPSRLLFR
jgi:hypothetical protein